MKCVHRRNCKNKSKKYQKRKLLFIDSESKENDKALRLEIVVNTNVEKCIKIVQEVRLLLCKNIGKNR